MSVQGSFGVSYFIVFLFVFLILRLQRSVISASSDFSKKAMLFHVILLTVKCARHGLT